MHIRQSERKLTVLVGINSQLQGAITTCIHIYSIRCIHYLRARCARMEATTMAKISEISVGEDGDLIPCALCGKSTRPGKGLESDICAACLVG